MLYEENCYQGCIALWWIVCYVQELWIHETRVFHLMTLRLLSSDLLPPILGALKNKKKINMKSNRLSHHFPIERLIKKSIQNINRKTT